MKNFIKLNKISLKNHPDHNEVWLQNAIAEDPSILGLGDDVVLKDRERSQRGAGRLDLLLQDGDGNGRYEVEIQLGASDESHIIRTIEYWDIERRRYPAYDHTAVIVAEDITSRFLNVISLFNGFIPLMAIQVSAIETVDGVGLHFTKILDTVQLGLMDEDEEGSEIVDRSYWETKKGTVETVKMADEIINIAQEFAPDLTQSYNKHYIGFWLNGKAFNFATCKPQRNAIRLEIKLPKTEDVDQIIEEAEIDILEYYKPWGLYRLKLNQSSIKQHRGVIANLLKRAFEHRQ